MGLLNGIRVLDFGRFIAGPYCAALLGDLGADVIRIERVEGGEDRYIPPVADTGEGGMFLQMNRNKRCLTLDLASQAGRDIVRKLVQSADVVVANLPPATLKQLGLDYATVSALNPRIVMVMVTAYGSGGPWSARPGFDGIGQAMSGAMFMTGTPDEPRRAVTTYVDFSTAQACAMGALAALWSREKTGQGQLVEGSLLRSAVIQTNGLLIEQAIKAPNRIPQGTRGFASAPSDAFKTTTGWLLVQTIGQGMFDRICDMMDAPAMKTDPRFASDELRGKNSADISHAIAAWCATRTRDEVLALLAKAKIPSGPVYSLQEALGDAQIQATGLLEPRHYAGLSQPYPMAPHPVEMHGSPAEFTRPPPTLGQHTDDILAELGFGVEAIAALRQERVV
jgi:formyl-CoA transferase